MARVNNFIEFNNFAKGLMTEASPLTYPKDFSKDEVNFELNRDGSRRRRLGLGFEANYQLEELASGSRVDGEYYTNVYVWRNAYTTEVSNLLVVRVGEQFKVYDMSSTPISSGLLYTHDLPTASGDLGFTSVDGRLVVVGTGQDVLVVTYDDGDFTSETKRLHIRDVLGVESTDPSTGADLREGDGIHIRPETSDSRHNYNLRNQGWSRAVRWRNEETLKDPIQAYVEEEVEFELGGDYTVTRNFPANSDVFTSALYPDANDSNDRVGDRFWPADLASNPRRFGQSPLGHFVIDALNRGQSRLQSALDLGFVENQVTSLPYDQSVDGATVVESFAGRVWFGGFTNNVIQPDKYTPRLASYIMFSQIVSSTEDIIKCYQSADPTSKEDSDLVDTDGGIVRLDGADRIVGMRNLGKTLLVFATNGVWAVDGGTELGFKTTSYRVYQVSTAGTDSPNSIVRTDDTVMYWSTDGVYAVAQTQVGDLASSNITSQTIQTFYHSIPYENRRFCSGDYDSFGRKVRWLYNNRPSSEDNVRELILDLDLGAWYYHDVKRADGSETRPVAIFQAPPYEVALLEEGVFSDGAEVFSDGEAVTVQLQSSRGAIRELMYLVVSSFGETTSFSFGAYNEGSFEDFGEDASAHIVTGDLTFGDAQRQKQLPWVTVHMMRTEDGFQIVDGDILPLNQSSCLMSSQWGWSNSANSGLWSSPQQVYRYKRFYLPEDVNDSFDTGFETVVTKNKVRGRGKSFSLRFETEPGKDCYLLGWSTAITMNENI